MNRSKLAIAFIGSVCGLGLLPTSTALAQAYSKPEIAFTSYSMKDALRGILENDFKEEDRTIMTVAGKPEVIFFYPNEWHEYRELERPEQRNQLGMDWENCAISARVSSYSIGNVKSAEPPKIPGSFPGTNRYAVRVKVNVIAFDIKLDQYLNVPSKWCTWHDLEVTDTQTGKIDKVNLPLPPNQLGALKEIDRLGTRTSDLPDYRSFLVPAHRRQWEFTVYMSFARWPDHGPLSSYDSKARAHVIRPFFPIHYSVDAQVESARAVLARVLIRQKDCDRGQNNQFDRCKDVNRDVDDARNFLAHAIKYQALAYN